jgi:hypothetical protein
MSVEKIITDRENKWNSTYERSKSAIRVADFLGDTFCPSLSGKGLDRVRHLLRFFNKFAFLTKKMCPEEKITISKVLPTYKIF